MVTTSERIVYRRPEALTEERTIFCPGCGHGIVTRLVAEVIDELGVREMSIGVASVGCSALIYDYFNVDGCEAAHGRAPAVATGLKRIHPDTLVFTYQGDGDLAAIGMAEIVHAATRGELISVIFVNNAIYGMTGGQMAPTTLPGQVTTSTPRGRDVRLAGYPVRVAELLSTLDGVAYIVRRAVYDPALISRTKKAIKKAFQVQLAGLGFSLVEVLSTCPTNWGLAPPEAMEWGKEQMMTYYLLGDYKVIEAVKELG